MRIGIDMGHSLTGGGTGAVGIIKETDKNRAIGKELISLLQNAGHIVVNCTVDHAVTTNEQLSGIVRKANEQSLDWFISIHFNAGGGRGTETYVYSGTGEATKNMAKKVNDSIVNSCGFVNRGLKTGNYFVLKNTSAKAMLIEVCFVDTQSDVNILDCSKVAKAIFATLTGQAVSNNSVVANSTAQTGYSKRDFIREVQQSIGAAADGIAGPETLSKTVTLSKTKNIRHGAVKPVQKYLNSIGFNCGVADGIAGQQFHNAVVSYQKANGLYADGEITAKNITWKRLLGLA